MSNILNLSAKWAQRSRYTFSLSEKWSPNSLDLNPVVFPVWAALQQKLYHQKIRDVDQLKHVLLDCWDQISQVTVDGTTKEPHTVDLLNSASTHAHIYSIDIDCEFLHEACVRIERDRFCVVLFYWNCAKNIKCDDIRYDSLNPDKELNSLIYIRFSMWTYMGITSF